MVDIVNEYTHTRIDTNELTVYIEGNFTIEKEGDNTLVVKVKSIDDKKP